MVPLTSPCGTAYSTGGGLTDGVEFYYLAEDQKGKTLKVPAQKASTLTSYFVKYYLCMTATGAIAALIYICADDNKKEGLIDLHEVVGLSLRQEALGTRYVVFSKTRAVLRILPLVVHYYIHQIRNRSQNTTQHFRDSTSVLHP